jgi:hypothetical protein
MSRRTRLGLQADGSIGLRVSASGFDALTASDDGHAITFDSRWTDIAKIGAIGVAGESVIANVSGTNIYGVRCFYPNFGYKPFVEVRRLDSGNIIHDDWWSGTFPGGSYGLIEATQCTLQSTGNPGGPLGLQAIFIVYQIPVPTQ